MTDIVAIACLSAACIVLGACVTKQPMEPGDADLLVTAERLRQAGLDLPIDYRRHESFERQRITGGVLILEYEFELPDGGPIYISSLAELHRTPGDACRSLSAGNFGIRLSGLRLSDRNDLFQYGAQSRFALIEDAAGAYVGNLFSMCHSRTAMFVMFVGLYFDDADIWSDFIAPHLRAVEAFEIANP